MNDEERKRVPEGGLWWRPAFANGADLMRGDESILDIPDRALARQIVGSVNAAIVARKHMDMNIPHPVQTRADYRYWINFAKDQPMSEPNEQVSDEELERIRLETDENQLDCVDIESSDVNLIVTELLARRKTDRKWIKNCPRCQGKGIEYWPCSDGFGADEVSCRICDPFRKLERGHDNTPPSQSLDVIA